MSMNPVAKYACTVCVSLLMLFTVLTGTIASSGGQGPLASPAGEPAGIWGDGTLFSGASPEGQTYTLQLDFAYPAPTITPNPEVDCVDVRMPDISTIHLAGQPELPREPVSIALEPGMLPKKVTVESGPCQVIDINKPVTPRLRPIPVGQYVSTEDAKGLYQMGDVYNAPGLFPQDLCKYRLTFGLTQKGDVGRDYVKLSTAIRSQYVDIELYPVQYDMENGHLYCYSELHLTMEYAKDPNYKAPMPTRATQYDELMITPASYVSTMKTLADQRNYTGLQSKIVSLDDIYNGIYFAASGADNAAKIKNFIKCAIESWNITYVLLGGDSGVVPYRTIYIDDGADGASTPSDLYFSDIYMVAGSYASWNSDGDGIWGEVSNDASSIDLRPDVYLGRLPCSSTTQLSNMITKIVNYENNNYGATFLKSVTFIGLDTFTIADGDTSGVAEGEYFGNNLETTCYPNSGGWTQNKLYDSLGTLSNANYALANNQQVGFMALSDHGSETSWGSFDLSTSDVSSMNNGYKLPIVSIDACLTGAFDYFMDSFAETYLKNPNGGGLCVFAASRIGYGYNGTFEITGLSGLMNTYFHKSYPADEAERVGQLNAGAETRYVSSEDEFAKPEDYKTICEYVFFGDPGSYIGGFLKTHAKIYSGNVTKTADPGKNATYTTYIENLGSTEAYIKFYTQTSDSDWFVTLNRTSMFLKAYENASVTMDVVVPGGATAGDFVTVSFIVRSSNLYESPLSVQTVTTANKLSNFTFTCDDPIHQVALGNNTIYTLRLNNNGNGKFLFNITTLSAPPDSIVFFTDDLPELEKYSQKIIQMTVRPGMSTINGSYEVVVRCIMDVYPDQPKDLTTNLTVQRHYAVDMQALTPTERSVAPGNEAQFGLHIDNLGNHEEKVDISLRSPLPSGWSTDLPPTKCVTLPPFSNTTLDIGVETPKTALAGTIDLEVVAKLNSTGLSASKGLSIEVLPEYGFSASSNLTKVSISQGPMDVYLNLTNLGNIQDAFIINLTGLDTWAIANPGEQTISPRSSKVLKITITPPANLPAGAYYLTASITSKGGKTLHNLTFELDMPALRGCELACRSPTIEANPGDSLLFTLDLKNTGNAHDAFTLAIEEPLWDASPVQTEVSMAPFCNNTVQVSAIIPDGTPMASYELKLKVVSRSDGSEQAEQTLTVKVKQVRMISIEAVSGQISVQSGKSTNFQFRLINQGNAPDTMRIYFNDKPERWTLTADKLITLNATQSYTGNVTLTTPDVRTEGATYHIALIASSETDGNCKDNLTMTVVLKPDTGSDDDIIDTPGNETSSLNWLYVVIPIAILIVIIIVVVVVILLMRSRKRPKEESTPAMKTDLPKQAWQTQSAPQAQPAAQAEPAKADEKPKTSDMVEPELVSIESQKDAQPEVYAAPEMLDASEQPVYEDKTTKVEDHEYAKRDENPQETPKGPQEEVLPEMESAPVSENNPADDDLDELISFEDLKEE